MSQSFGKKRYFIVTLETSWGKYHAAPDVGAVLILTFGGQDWS